ncbi:mRNA cap methyltransferase [Aspergillus lentulus]|uniref:mRNA cap guanine-N(7) methyltransferase n=2 Tax=Aspergillus lentulus TaxID=293939 RepID=A0ABQ1ASA0_ASPLE|nr:mRNA cap methyltransferase [Aspergillus lentulus]GFF27543.1 mRNA cap methyltransferase [Aspergillus lentulus]GFF48357.1 mRNA cap methyltransferase [Aspergillus lentulus]GFF82519.1 mRNA cap methyltransferase [Aspergillus lentulus]GFF87177.1 mRNA cap methyltransferase [Aspergillus lentulus]GFG02956.1 mRNA cap methyltransferase [Aspergillus lentulus]
MYDPARDSWEKRDGDEARSRRGRLASDQPHAGFSSSEQIHSATGENNNTTELQRPHPDSKTTASTEVLYAASQPAQSSTRTPSSVSTHLQSPANLAAQEASHTQTLTSRAQNSPNKAIIAMENRSDSATPKPRSDPSGKPNRPDEVAPPTDQNGSQGDKKRKVPAEENASEKSQPTPDRPVSKRKRMEERHQKLRKRGRTPPSAYSRRDADERASAADRNSSTYRSTSPLPPPRSPTPEDQPRQRKRPGGGARMGLVDRETLRRRQEERERAQVEEAMRASQGRGVADVVRQHYNAVPQRGREWRKTESKIKGLRSFNNWVKSTLIQKFSPDEEFLARFNGTKDWAEDGGVPPVEEKRLLVIDLGCGKGGDLGKWQLAPQPVDLYVGLDPAEVSIVQARERYNGMKSGRGNRGRRNPIFHAEFQPKDCFGEWLGDLDIVQQVGIDPNVGPGGSAMSSRWGGGGFDVVASMFTIHYAFESEEKARQMLRNVAGCLKKGGRFLGVCPNSDVISARVAEINAKKKERQAQAKKEKTDEAPEDGEVEEDDGKVEWGNQIYRVRFPVETPEDGIFRPPFGWKYSYFMEEAVEEVPEYVVPWEAFRALTEDYNLELQYRKPFLDIWRDEKDDPELGPLSERMGVRDRATGELLMTEEEKEAASFYHAFCFYKV